MVEPIGLTVGLLSLAGLFSTCIDCFDFYEASKDCGDELRTLLVQLDLEKTRLLTWAEHVGLVHVNSRNRHHDLEKLEPSIRNVLQEIMLLLAEANEVQERFGLQQRPGTEVVQGSSTALVSKNSFATYQANYRRFCTKFETVMPKPKFTLRIRWAIRDGARFRGLINTLKDLIDGLYSLVSLGSDAQNESIEVDIMEIIDLSDLHIVEEACEASSYPALSAAASLAIDRTESGTIDRRTAARGHVNLPQRKERVNAANVTGSDKNMLNNLSSATPFFMITDRCLSFADPCAGKDFGAWSFTHSHENIDFRYASQTRHNIGRRLVGQIKLDDFAPGKLDDVLHTIRKREAEGELEIIDTLAVVVVYVAPCMRLINTALGVCQGLSIRRSEVLQFMVRVDDRLRSSCCESTEGCQRLKELVQKYRRPEISTLRSERLLLEFLDVVWIEQRIYELEENPEAPTDARNVSHIFRADKDELADEKLAAILVIGEEEDMVEIMDLLPLEKTPRVPRVAEFYKVEWTLHNTPGPGGVGSAGNYMWSRKFLGNIYPKLRTREQADRACYTSLAGRAFSRHCFPGHQSLRHIDGHTDNRKQETQTVVAEFSRVG